MELFVVEVSVVESVFWNCLLWNGCFGLVVVESFVAESLLWDCWLCN